MSNKFELKFEKSLSGLAGYDFGAETYKEQVQGTIDFGQKISFVFPDNIQRIASSFIQGFFEEIVENIGITGIEENVQIISSKSDMKEIIINNLV